MSYDDRFDFMPLVGSYLAYRVDPAKTEPSFTWPSFRHELGIPEETFNRLFPLVKPIIDDYVEAGAKAITDQQLDRLAEQTARRIIETYATIAPPGESIDPGSASYFTSTPYSDLPVLLMYYLGVIETAVYYLGQNYLYYAPNEWRALVKAGLNLCEYNGDYPYLYYLIKSIYFMHPSYREIRYMPGQIQLAPRPSYTSQDLIDSLSSANKRGECLLTEKDLRNLQNAYQEAEEKYQKSLEELGRELISFKGIGPDGRGLHYTDEEIERLGDVVRLRNVNNRKRALLDAINQVLPIIGRLTKSRAISGALAELGPFSRFPGGEQYRVAHETGRAEFEAYGGGGVNITQRLNAIRNNPNVTWEQLLPIAVDLGILVSDRPQDLQDLLINEIDRLIEEVQPRSRSFAPGTGQNLRIGAEVQTARPSRIAQIADMFALDQPIDRDALLDYLIDWRQNIQTITDWPTLLQSATALSLFTLPYERRAFRDYLLDYASQL